MWEFATRIYLGSALGSRLGLRKAGDPGTVYVLSFHGVRLVPIEKRGFAGDGMCEL